MAIKLKITSGDYSIEGTSATIKCNGKKLAEDLVIECVEVADVALISFTIDGATYQAVDGMRWYEWLESEYNTGGFYADFPSNQVLTANGDPVVILGGSPVEPNYLISANGNYYIASGGSN